MRYELITAPPAAAVEAVLDVLRSYNRKRNATFYAVRDLPENAAVPLHVLAYDEDGAVAGGAIGKSQFKWAKVTYLAVRDDLRGRGVGRRLMEEAEAEARRRGCRYVFLDTMSYQAPEFYRKLGYHVAGELADWDSHGSVKYFFVKTLGEEAE
jgi:ribosomal protein S18 acetylase RimI-like enzyme